MTKTCQAVLETTENGYVVTIQTKVNEQLGYNSRQTYPDYLRALIAYTSARRLYERQGYTVTALNLAPRPATNWRKSITL